MVASKHAFCFFALASCALCASSISDKTSENCDAQDSSCNAAHAASILQGSSSKVKAVLNREEENSRGTSKTKYIAGVPVHNFHESTENWIFGLQPDATDEQIHTFCSGLAKCSLEGHSGDHGVPFIAAVATSSELEEILTAHPETKFVEPDSIVNPPPDILDEVDFIKVPQRPADQMSIASTASRKPSKVYSWGLDRIDDRTGLDQGYDGTSDWGNGAHIYVLDTGLNENHLDFEDRAVRYLDMTTNNAPEFCATSSDSTCCGDDGGHGTHCAGTAGGFYSGVAKGARIYGVKVLRFDNGCNPAPGPCGWTSWIVGGIDQVVAQKQGPTVISMSLGGAGRSSAYEAAIDSATNAGVTVVVAAGNSNSDACSFSPAFVPSAITVGSTTDSDQRSSFSNFGPCLDIYAPGSAIVSSFYSSTTHLVTMSGTSMACPHVAGAAAIILAEHPDATPAYVRQRLLELAGSDLISDARSGSPNKLLFYAEPTPQPTPQPTTNPTPDPPTPAPPTPDPPTPNPTPKPTEKPTEKPTQGGLFGWLNEINSR